MRSTFNVLFFLKKNAKKKDGTAPIVARITINGKNSQFNTKQFITKDIWNVELNRVKGWNAEAKKINGVLDEIKSSLRNHYND
ncbi:Phage integrase SAM-like domain-containing protein [Saccharicrinis carchari]|uniref:Phage integrase SAM-like domain-containing protein n=1 Tax=Saccharicrinis carchari TaxID=1168039 RepID=A0A521E3D3_SACCC|nr:Arm DNA-binding domain-containing protein [Saccharicrinis carchari]SMO77630.1 Phage integrase SAM-like domain-containing protein [Saccharicrinis carchari]